MTSNIEITTQLTWQLDVLERGHGGQQIERLEDESNLAQPQVGEIRVACEVAD
jgi:hypothetical protein